MKKNGVKNRWVYRGVLAVAAYGLLLGILTLVERGEDGSSIQSFSDALWYSIVTLSTVGYGDLYPVTWPGKIIGLLFVLMSVGVLALLMGAAVGLLTGKMLPALQMRLLRKKPWFVFSACNEEALVLAEDLANNHPDGVFLFPGQSRGQAPAGLRCVYYSGTAAQAAAGKKDNCRLIFIGEDGTDNYTQGLGARDLGFPVYCRSEQSPDSCPENLTLFNRYDCCAREYWRSRGLGIQENKVVLIGDGRYAESLLERGLLLNVFGEDRNLEYHVFGDWHNFRNNHPQLALTLNIDSRGDWDSLYFHNDPWNSDAELLCSADRIILCADREGDNQQILRQLRRYFPTEGMVHLRSGVEIPGEDTFGGLQCIYTEEMVMRSRLNTAAQTMHNVYREGTGGKAPAWEELSEFTRQSNISAADHLLIKIRMLLADDSITDVTAENCRAAYERYIQTREQNVRHYRFTEHQRWMRFHSLYNWCYGPVRDNSKRIHPLMLPYDELEEREQEKDEYAWQILGDMAKALTQ